MFTELLDIAVGFTDVDLDAEVRASELELRRLQARRAALVAVSQARGSFRFEGHRSVAGYLRGSCNVSGAEAARWRRLATVCDAVPELGEALHDGRVGVDQVIEIGRIHANPRTRGFFAAVASIYLERAEHCTHADLRCEVDSFLNVADQDGSFAQLAANIDGRNATMHAVGGRLEVAVSGGDPVVAEEVVATFEWFCQQQFRADVDARRDLYGDRASEYPLARTARQRRFDAFVAMVRGGAAHGDGAAPAKIVVNLIGDIETFHDTLADADIVIHTDTDSSNHGSSNTDDRRDHGVTDIDSDIDTHQDSDSDSLHDPDGDWVGDGVNERDVGGGVYRVELGDDDIDDIISAAGSDPTGWVGRRCETSSGIAIHPKLLLQAAITGLIRRVVLDSRGVVIDYGRTQRLFPGHARDAAKLLIRSCEFFGCNVSTTYADIDHADEWHAGGRTDQHNSAVPCGSHNRYKSRARWQVRRDESGRKFHVRPDGTAVLPVGARQPDFTIDEQHHHIRQRLRQLRRSST